jgi:hypothetical protein
MYAGLESIASTPEFYYVLGFSPQNLKFDGRFHSIKVEVKYPAKLSVQARKGYFAPKHAPDPVESEHDWIATRLLGKRAASRSQHAIFKQYGMAIVRKQQVGSDPNNKNAGAHQQGWRPAPDAEIQGRPRHQPQYQRHSS